LINSITKAYMIRLKAAMKSIIASSIAYGVGIIMLAIIPGILLPQLYTSAARYALEALAAKLLGTNSANIPNEALGAVAAAIYTPYLATLIAAIVTSNTVSSTLIEDRNEGVLEVLFSAPVSRRSITVALLFYTLLVALIVEALIMVTASGISLLFLHLLGYLSSLSIYYVKLSIILTPSLTISASLISLILTVIIPSLRGAKTGPAPGQNVLAGISMLPALIPFIVLNINPQMDPVELALYTLMFSATLTSILLPLLPRILKEEAFLR